MNNESKRLQIEKATIADDEHNEIIKTMTPQEKAKELVKKFMSIDSDSEKFDGFKMGFFYAQRCALIMINELLSNSTFLLSNGESYYWNQVKQEIEKL